MRTSTTEDVASRYSRLAQVAKGWGSQQGRSVGERRQAMAIASISTMLHERRFPHDCEVKVLSLLVCKLCAQSGEGASCLSKTPNNGCAAPFIEEHVAVGEF